MTQAVDELLEELVVEELVVAAVEAELQVVDELLEDVDVVVPALEELDDDALVDELAPPSALDASWASPPASAGPSAVGSNAKP